MKVGSIMYRAFAVASSLLIIGPVLGTGTTVNAEQAASSRTEPHGQDLRKPFERFDGRTTLQTKEGKPRKIHVVVRNWVIDNRQRIPQFPETGFVLVELRAGQVTTVIENQRQARKEGDFWTVPAGSSMSVETGTESAVLQTLAVQDEP